MDASGVTTAATETLTTVNELLACMKFMATMREEVVVKSCKEYLTCHVQVPSPGKRERYKSLQIHLENRHAMGKKQYLTTVDGRKTFMVDYTAPGLTV